MMKLKELLPSFRETGKGLLELVVGGCAIIYTDDELAEMFTAAVAEARRVMQGYTLPEESDEEKPHGQA